MEIYRSKPSNSTMLPTLSTLCIYTYIQLLSWFLHTEWLRRHHQIKSCFCLRTFTFKHRKIGIILEYYICSEYNFSFNTNYTKGIILLQSWRQNVCARTWISRSGRLVDSPFSFGWLWGSCGLDLGLKLIRKNLEVCVAHELEKTRYLSC